jgi:Zinc carboxypeptidase
MTRSLPMALALLAAVRLPASPAEIGPDTPEPGAREAIAAATSEPRFLSPWISDLPDSSNVPSPRDFLGRIAGAPGELADTAKSHAYLRALAQTSPRARVFTLGRSEEGREILMLAVADEEGIRDLDRLKAATAALADPRRTDPAAAERLVETGRPLYYFNAVLHSDETGSTEAMLELAYRLAVSEQPMIRRIRKELVVLINPVSNPDGRDKVVEWFYRFLKGKNDYGALPRQSPPYWSKYAFVDINRDTHQQVHEATKAVHRMFHEWHPTVVHDLHEAIALLLTWNGTGPYNPNIDPITHGEFLEQAFHEVQALTALGMPGVWTWNFGEAFGHHYLDSVAMNHNSLGRGYETWGNATAETVRRVLDASDATMEWYRPSPPPREFTWSARDNVNYTETGALAALDYAARNAKEMLRNFYMKGWNSWRKGVDEAPHAFVIPDDQGDRTRVAQLVARLLGQKIEVSRAQTPLVLKEGRFPAGSYVVRLDQPYRNYAVDLLTPQRFPKDGGEPYDDISWALPAHYRLDAFPIADTAVKTASLLPLVEVPNPSGTVSGAGPVLVLEDSGQEGLLAARYRLTRFKVEVAERSFRIGNADFPAGSWILPAQDGLAAAAKAVATDLGLDFSSAASVPDVSRHEAGAPRLGLLVPWADTDSIGWVRYALDQRQVPYTYLRDEDVRAGNLRGRVDVLLYGHVDLELAEQIHGLPKAWGPMPFKKTPQTPSHGTPAESADVTGGMGWEGLAHLQRFVEDGGLLVTLGSGSALALEAGIVRGVRRVAGGVPRSSQGGGEASAAAAQRVATRTPGAHLRVTFRRPDHPLAYGYPKRTHVFRQNFPLYDTPRRWLRMAYCTSCLDGPEDASGVVLEWGDREGALFVVSGQAWGEGSLVGRPAVLDLAAGKGHVVAFNFNPLHRDLNRGDHRLVWNAILNWQSILAGGSR